MNLLTYHLVKTCQPKPLYVFGCTSAKNNNRTGWKTGLPHSSMSSKTQVIINLFNVGPRKGTGTQWLCRKRPWQKHFLFRGFGCVQHYFAIELTITVYAAWNVIISLSLIIVFKSHITYADLWTVSISSWWVRNCFFFFSIIPLLCESAPDSPDEKWTFPLICSTDQWNESSATREKVVT